MIIDNNTLLNIMQSNIENKISSSFIRKGDGENIFIGYGIIHAIKLRKYLKMVKIMNLRYSHYKFHHYIKKELISAFYNCDYLGIAPKNYTHGAWKYESEVLEKFNLNQKKYCDMNFHLEFIKVPDKNILVNSIAEKIITNKNIGIISCHEVDSLINNYNSTIVSSYKLIKQGENNLFNKITLNTYNEVFKLIKNSLNVDLWIVGAGIHAKIFCNYIKNNKGVAIDIGSSIDTWANIYNHRGHLRKLYSEYSK